jgi:hypothetical protein
VSANPFEALGGSIARAGVAPLVLRARQVPAFQVDFQALEVLVAEEIPLAEKVVLELLKVLGSVTADDVRGYLGLGLELAQSILNYLMKEGLVRLQGQTEPVEDPLWTRILALLGMHSVAPPSPAPQTQARRLFPPDPGWTGPRVELTHKGSSMLAAGQSPHVLARACSLAFWAEPPHFVDYVGAKRRSTAPPIREQSEIPSVLVHIDKLLALDVARREAALGLGKKVQNLDGLILGVAPRSEWEVRPMPRMKTFLCMAGFAGDDAQALEWRVFTGDQRKQRPAARLASAAADAVIEVPVLRDALSRSMEGYLEGVPVRGAFRVRCDAQSLISLLGPADEPRDRWLPLEGLKAPWSTAVRVRGLPDSELTAHMALAEMLGRQEASLRGDFPGTVARTWAMLGHYWDEPGAWAPPSREWLLEQLWQRAGLRGVVCTARMIDDLVTAYREGAVEAR